MAKYNRAPGSTSQRFLIKIFDSSVSTGAGLASLAYNTASLTAYYVRPGATPVAITLATQTVTGSWATGGFVALDNTNMPGWYLFDCPNAVLAAGVTEAGIQFKGATNMAQCDLEIDLNSQVNVTAVNGTNLGSGPIPEFGIFESGTAVSATSTTLVGRAAATDDIVKAGMILWAYGSTQGYWQSVMIVSVSGDTFTIAAWPNAVTPSGTISYIVFGTPQTPAALNPSVNLETIKNQTVTAAAGVTFPSSIASTTNITAGTITTATNVTTVNGLAANVITAAATAPDFTTEVTAGVATLTNQTAIKTKTDFLPSVLAGAAGGVFIAGTNAATTVTTGLTTNLVGNVTGSVNSVTSPVTAGTVSDKSGYALTAAAIDAILNRQITETYAANGVAPTLAQALMLIQQTVGDFTISGATLTARRIDGVTASATYTLSDPNSPTSRTRTT